MSENNGYGLLEEVDFAADGVKCPGIVLGDGSARITPVFFAHEDNAVAGVALSFAREALTPGEDDEPEDSLRDVDPQFVILADNPDSLRTLIANLGGAHHFLEDQKIRREKNAARRARLPEDD